MSIPSVFGFIIAATTFQYAPGLVIWLFVYAAIWGLIWYLGEKLPVKYESRYMTSSIALMATLSFVLMAPVIVHSKFDFEYLADPIILMTLAIWIFMRPGLLSSCIAGVYTLLCAVYGIFSSDGGISPIYTLLNFAIVVLLIINTLKMHWASHRDDSLWEDNYDA